MAYSNFKPEIWSARQAYHLDKLLVYGQPIVANRDHEGEISAAGDRVKINQIGNVTTGDYDGSDIGDPEELSTAGTYMDIDQQKFFNFAVDDVDAAQSNAPILDMAMMRAAYSMADTIDQNIAANLSSNVATSNTIGSVASPKTDLGTAGNAYEYLVDLGVLLDESNVPSFGRYVVIPPWFSGVLKKDSTYMVGTGSTFGDQIVVNGQIGTLAGFTLLVSNNVPNTSGTKYKIIAGVSQAFSFASQLIETEAYRPHGKFKDAIKGLQVFGRKVTHPSALAMLIANKP